MKLGIRRIVTIVCILAASSLSIGCDNEELRPIFNGDYSSWERTVPEPLTYPIPGHGAKRRGIFINEIGTRVEVTEDGDGEHRYEYPDGTIIVKENFSDLEGTTLENLTIMTKDTGDPRARRGWVWVNRDVATGEEAIFTENEFCIGCHTAANENHPYGAGNPDDEFRDYVFFPYIPAVE